MGKALMKRVMQTWLHASSALLEMMAFHLRSPTTTQKYHVENLYEGPLDDAHASAISKDGNWAKQFIDSPTRLMKTRLVEAARLA